MTLSESNPPGWDKLSHRAFETFAGLLYCDRFHSEDLKKQITSEGIERLNDEFQVILGGKEPEENLRRLVNLLFLWLEQIAAETTRAIAEARSPTSGSSDSGGSADDLW